MISWFPVAAPVAARRVRFPGAPLLLAILMASGLAAPDLAAQYFPPAGDGWERRAPGEVGMNAERLAAAIASAVESQAPRDLLENHTLTFGREPLGEAIGPFKDRGDATGIVVRHGYIVAEWGEPERVDLTFSVTKSFLSATVGLAYDRGLIRDVHDPVRDYFPPVVALRTPPGGGAPSGATPTGAAATGPRTTAADPCAGIDRSGATPIPLQCLVPERTPQTPGAGAAFDAFEVLQPFESELARRITWDHLLRQTSDWQGTLWGKPDWADRPRGDLEEWRNRPGAEPGSTYMYNDVRVNLLALAALNVWRRPLPEVLKEYVMDPIGASGTWRWYGYDNSWVVLDGRLVQSVSGGAHWGGGMWLSARDQARFGLLTLHRGRWDDQQILSDEWVSMALTPTPVQQNYGFMNWYLRGDPVTAFTHNGAGPNIVYVDPVNDLIVVTRWITNWNAVVQGIVEAIER